MAASDPGWNFAVRSFSGAVGALRVTGETIEYPGDDFTLNAGDTFTALGSTFTFAGTAGAGGTTGFVATQSNGDTWYFTKAALPDIATPFPSFDASGTILVCFCTGTRILTAEGERAVETLAPGDLVATADGRLLPVRWIGRQTVSTRFGTPLRTLPVRIAAGALGAGLPARDLLVSPAHAVLVDGVLIEAGALVNGTTIARERVATEMLTYHHVELAEHALLLAEGTPAESFVDTVAREHFDNRAEHEALPDAAPITEMDTPRARSARQVPVAIRRRLDAIAAARVSTAAA